MYVRTRLPLAAGGTVRCLRRRTSSTLATATSHIPHAWKYLTKTMCEDIQVMWKDATGFVTSFQTKLLPSLLLATALGGKHLAHYRLPAPSLRSISQQYVVTASHPPSNAARSTFYICYPYKHTLPVRFITSSRGILLLQYLLLRTQTPIAPIRCYVVPDPSDSPPLYSENT
jgi:hypothetical protein